MNDPQEFLQHFEPLFADLRGEDAFPAKTPLLAHYTSVPILEAVLKNHEVWFSNPLFMNDTEEVRFGMTEGANLFLASPEIESVCKSKERFGKLRSTFIYWYDTFAKEHVLDLYAFCLSVHAKEDTDGVLSMWRAYGGNGSGAAIVFDTAKLPAREESSLVIREVRYGTPEERKEWLKQYVTQFAGLFKSSNLPDDQLSHASYYFFHRLKFFAVFTKHIGFAEEKEWRVAYFKDRDEPGAFDEMLSYDIGPRGVEPKLKLKIGAIPGFSGTDVSLAQLVDRIILGPTSSAPLVRDTILRMLEKLNLSDLEDRVFSSKIPFRGR